MGRMIARTALILCAAPAMLFGFIGCRDILLRQVVENLVTEYQLGYLPGWTEPALLENLPGTSQSHAAAIGSGDKIFVVWGHYVDSPQDSSVYVNRYIDGAWAGPEEIDSVPRPSTGSAGDPDVAVGSDGYAFVIFGQQDAAEYRPFARRFSGGAWTAGGYLDSTSYTMSLGESVQIGMDSAEKTLAVWIENDGATVCDVKARLRPDSATAWQSEVALENPDGSAWWCRLAVSGNGNAAAVWEQQDGAVNNIYANLFDGTNWAGAQKINGTTGDGHLPDVEVSAAGTAVAVWVSQDAGQNLRVARHNGTTWVAPVELESLAGQVYMPAVAVAADGKALVVWCQNDGTAESIFSSFFNGTSWSSPAVIEHSDDMVDNDSAQVAFAPDGTAIAVWVCYSGGFGTIRYNHFNGSSWGQEAMLSPPGVGSNDPVLDISPEGHAVVAWRGQPDGTSDWNVYASIYRP